MATAEIPSQIQLNFNANAVAAPAQIAAREADEIVAFAMNAIDAADLSQRAEANQKGFFHASMDGPDRTAEERKNDYVNWILVRGFLELARGTKASLEEAMLFIEGLKLTGRQMTIEQVNGEVAAIKKRANRRNFEQLLKKVNAGLREPTSFDREFLSLQKVRNILEHRAGIVGAQDVGDAQTLELLLPRLGLFHLVDGEEHEIDAQQHFEAGALLYMKRATRKRTFILNERITFTATQFNEIAFSCHLFASDLASKLPEAPAQH